MKLSSKQTKKSNKSVLITAVCCTFFLCLGIYLGWKNVPGFIKANFVLLSKVNIWNVITVKNDLDTLKLHIPFKSLQSIEAKRQQALKIGKLYSSDEDLVKAQISHNGIVHKCKIRLKGDLPDHWSNDKISLRVKMINSNIKGLINFSLQRPGTRQDTGQWLFLESLKKEDIMVVDYDFINLHLNGKNLGVYTIEGHFNSDIFEKNRKRESVIIAFDESRKWGQNKNLTNAQLASKLLNYSEIVVRREKSVQKSNFLSEQAVIAKNLLRNFINRNLSPDDVFDSESLGKFLALTRIWNADHSLHFHNINFYFNPITCKLEPIGFDGMPGYSEQPNICYHLTESPFLSWVKIALESQEICESYSKYLLKFSSSEYFANLKLSLSKSENYYRSLLVRNLVLEDQDTIWSSYYTIFTNEIWEVLDERLKRINSEFTRIKPIESFIAKSPNGYELNIKNCIEKPIEIVSISNDGITYYPIKEKTLFTTQNTYLAPANYSTVSRSSNNGFLTFHLPDFDYNNSNKLILKSKYFGTDVLFLTDTSYENFNFNKEHVALKDKTLPVEILDFVEINGSRITFNSGKHVITHPVYVDEGYVVEIPGGTTLSFSNDSFFVSKSKIIALGTKEEPIKFNAVNNLWPGLIINSYKTKSIFQFVTFEDLSGIGNTNNKKGIKSNGWNLTGGINLYKSNVEFSNCLFYNCLSEDALNIISSSFLLTDCNFSHCLSDAFDGDFVTGELTGCKFEQINGDGADFSGSVVTVKNSIFNGITDKAVSVGENSQVNVINCNINNVSFGVVSKDLSKTLVSSGTIVSNSKIAAFSAFQKKDSFGPSEIIVEDSKTTLSSKDFLIQEGSSGFVNDYKIPTSVFNTLDLYRENNSSEFTK